MKFTAVYAGILLTLAATGAHAGEGNGNPFPFQVPGTTLTLRPAAQAAAVEFQAQPAPPRREAAEVTRQVSTFPQTLNPRVSGGTLRGRLPLELLRRAALRYGTSRQQPLAM